MKSGFTLLEVMIVMIVIALLFLLTVPNIFTVLSIIQKRGCDAQLSVVDAAILQYHLLHDAYPSSMDDLIFENLLRETHRTCQNGREIILENNQAIAP